MMREENPGLKKSVLVIDDEVDLVEMVKFQLEVKGYEVSVAFNGKDALKKLEGFTPDLIILDINMPEMGGVEFYNKISTAYGRPRIPVLILTARANLQKIFEDIDVDGFMPKPFEIEELISEVDRIINKPVNPVIFLLDFIKSSHVKEITKVLQAERYVVINLENFDTLKNRVKLDTPDFIIMEYMQKGISGAELIRKIKNDAFLKKVPVIVYSYTGFDDYREKSLNAGASLYLGKPSDCNVFVTAVRDLQSKRKNLSR